MQVAQTKQMTYEIFHLLRQLADTQVAALCSWRDVLQYCEAHDMSLVAPEHGDEWLEIATRAILSIQWLCTLYPSSDDTKPTYWSKWESSMEDQVFNHLSDVMRILAGQQTS